MTILLNFIYLFIIAAASPVILWRMIRYGKYREGFAEKFLGLVPRTPNQSGRVIWFHAVSVGEVNLLKPIIPLLKTELDIHILISSTSKTGYRLAQKLFSDLTVFYCPLDFSWSVKRALRRLCPDLLVLAELELWPNLLREASKQGIKTAIINGRISDSSFRNYKMIRPLIRPVFKRLDFVAASGKTAADRFLELGVRPDSLIETGSIKFDGVQTDRRNPKTTALADLAGIDLQKEIVFLAGSTQDPEEESALGAFRHWSAEFPNLKLILVPRHPERFDTVAKLLDDSGLPWTRRSLLGKGAAPSSILLVDTVGELGAWWGTASIAFVGGSFGKRGGQNMLEPAAYGAAVSFGPNTKNFREISERMLRQNAAVVVRNTDELSAFLGKCLRDPQYRNDLGRRALQLVLSQQGACRKTLDALKNLFLQK